MIGEVLARKYELIAELGKEPAFTVYHAKEIVSGKSYKIRVISPQVAAEPAFMDELRDIVDQHARLDGTNVERIKELIHEDDVSFLVSDHVEGSILSDRLKRLKTFSIPVALSTAIGVAEALDECHRSGMVHGDVSTRTVFSRQSEGLRLMLPGLWQAYGLSSRAAREVLPAMAPYLAPEIAEGSMPSPQSDIYATGVLLYQLLVGSHPFRGETPADISRSHAEGRYVPLGQAIGSSPQVLGKIVEKCLSRDPEERYPTAAALLRDLRLMQDGLRFGRPLKWPLEGKVEAEEPETQAVAPVPEEADVRAEKRAQKRRDAEKRRRDGVPAVLAFLLYITTAVAVAGLGFWLFINIQQPEDVQVPNMVGMQFEEAEELLRPLNLKLKRRDKISEELPEGAIISTSPAAGRAARADSFVDAVVSAGSLMVEVPDLEGMTVAEARRALAALDLELEPEYKEQRDDDVPAGKIISQTPDTNKSVERKTRVEVVVSSGKRTSRPESDEPQFYTFKMTIQMPRGEREMEVRVEMEDEEGTSEVHVGVHLPEEIFTVTADGLGKSATFKIYLNNQLAETRVVKAEER